MPRVGFSLSVKETETAGEKCLANEIEGGRCETHPPPAVRLRGRRLLGGTWPRSAPVGLQPRQAAKASLAQKKGQRGLWRGHLAG